MCLPIKVKDTHKCIEKAAHDNCPVCLENLHSSRIPSHIPACGHLLHTSCYEELTRAGHYACPLCGVSMLDMAPLWRQMDEEIAATPLPEEYRHVLLYVLCKDCHKESKVLYHIIGLKCDHCGSYNTCRSKNPDSQDSAGSTEDEAENENDDEEDDETLTLTITNTGNATSNTVNPTSSIEIAMDTSASSEALERDRPMHAGNDGNDTDEDLD